ncbi:MAG: hypothetical protein JWN70_6603 [Planctomycetaceae bacterium]|nr:hypothetical protein [Planctomycetaceae bacterium]
MPQIYRIVPFAVSLNSLPIMGQRQTESLRLQFNATCAACGSWLESAFTHVAHGLCWASRDHL